MTTAATDPPVRTGADRLAELSTDLAAVLRTGPFEAALDLAIRQRGLSLEAVQRRMTARGATVSQATLSYWRRGRRHPEGDRSLRAVRILEDCLGLPRDALTALIGPQRPRGRWVNSAPAPISLATALGIEPAALGSCDGIDLEGNARMAIASVHEHVRIGADRTERSVSTELVVTSKVDGVDRWVCFFSPQSGDSHKASIMDTHCCAPARMRTDPGTGLMAVELRFDYPLRSGQTYVFGFTIGYEGPPPPTDFVQYGLRTPARLLLLQVSFDPAALPVRCYRYYRPRADPLSKEESELSLGPSMTTHNAVLDAQPGVHGIQWEWE